MSYDIFFYSPKDRPLDPAALAPWARQFPPITVHDLEGGGLTIQYDNNVTEVVFCLQYTPPTSAPKRPTDFPEFRDSGLSFNINFNRPSFYIEEAAPILESLTRQFSLAVLDPQAHPTEKPDYAPRPFDTALLVQTWQAGNAVATRSFAAMTGDKPVFLAPDRMRLWWNYNRNREALQKQLGEAIFVPSLRLFYHDKRKEPVLVMAWTDNIPTVFPNADVIVLVRQRKRFLGLAKRLETGHVDAKMFLEKIDTALKPLESDPTLRYLPPERTRTTFDTFWNHRIDPDMKPLLGLSALNCTDVESGPTLP